MARLDLKNQTLTVDKDSYRYNECKICKKPVGQVAYFCQTLRRVFCQKCSKSDNNDVRNNPCARSIYRIPALHMGGFMESHVHHKIKIIFNSQMH